MFGQASSIKLQNKPIQKSCDTYDLDIYEHSEGNCSYLLYRGTLCQTPNNIKQLNLKTLENYFQGLFFT